MRVNPRTCIFRAFLRDACLKPTNIIRKGVVVKREVLSKEGDPIFALQLANRKALGFSAGGVLSSRSAMLPELTSLLAVAPPDAALETFRYLVVDQDALHKTSAANRQKTFAFVRRLYGLNPAQPVFREFRRLSLLSPGDLPGLAALTAFAREPLLRACADMVMATGIGKSLAREDFEAWVREFAPGRFSQSMYVSFSHNLYASFFQLGYLGEAVGKRRLRQRVNVQATSAAFAAFLDWLTGLNGLSVLEARFSRALDLGKSEHLSLLSAAGQQGLMRVAHAGGVLHMDFSSWLRPGEARLSI